MQQLAEYLEQTPEMTLEALLSFIRRWKGDLEQAAD